MAHRRLESVFDLARSRLDVLVTCTACGRRAAFDPEQVIAFFSAKGWHLGLPLEPTRFRCRCRSRELVVGIIDQGFRPKPLPIPAVELRPIYWLPAER